MCDHQLLEKMNVINSHGVEKKEHVLIKKITLQGAVIIPGTAAGTALVSPEPLSFWGGYDFHTGEITDRRHPLSGEIAAGKVLGVPFSRGSSTTTAVLLEAVRAGTAPLAIITTDTDSFFALAAIVAGEMYEHTLPVIALAPDDYKRLRTGDDIQILIDGRLMITRSKSVR